MAVLIAGGGSSEEVRRYARAFAQANLDAVAGSQLPCPRCFLRGIVSPLEPLEDPGDPGSVRCPTCGETLQWRGDA